MQVRVVEVPSTCGKYKLYQVQKKFLFWWEPITHTDYYDGNTYSTNYENKADAEKVLEKIINQRRNPYYDI